MNKEIALVRKMILLLNIIIVFFMEFILYFGVEIICDTFTAKSFVYNVNAIPSSVETIIFRTVFIFIFLICSVILREYYFKNDILAKYISLLADCFFCVLTIYLLDFNYNGILFWLFANIMLELKSDRKRYAFCFILILFITITNYEVISRFINLYDINNYINVFNNTQTSIIYIVLNILVSINTALFLSFMFFLILKKDNIIAENNLLNKKLYEVNDQLLLANDELKKMSNLREKMGETRERNRLAREIHDTLGHTLTGLLTSIEACIVLIDEDIEFTKKQLILTSTVARNGIIDVRNSVRKLKPDVLQKLNLNSSIEKIINDSQKLSKVQFIYESNIENDKYSEDEEMAIYRLVQESITNTLRYANATIMSIKITRQDKSLLIEIKDNGVGCEDFKYGFGTKHIIEQINLLGGSIEFSTNNGFSINAIIQIRGAIND